MQHVANVTNLQEVAEETAIEVSGVSHVYAGPEGGVPALENISMRVGVGRFVVIVGPSGCGKTSLLMMLAGLRQQTRGEILCYGRPMPDPDPDRVGVIFQEASLFPWLTGLDNIEFPLSLRGTPREERARRAGAMLTLVGLEGFGGRYPHELSGGMKQRVSIARALAVDPSILLMDEPFGALDAQTRSVLQEELLRIWRVYRKTVVFVTHSIEEAIYLSDRIMVMTARPGLIKTIISVGQDRPRDMTSPDMAEMQRRVRAVLSEEIDRAAELEQAELVSAA